jgi:CrcB protein
VHPAEDPDVAIPIDPDLTPGGHAPDGRGRRSTRTGSLGVLAAIALGGALGAPARYEVSRVVHVARDTFPWSTFWTNVTGSLALGFLIVLIIERFPPSRYARPFVAIGFLGAYTTMSTFMVETALLIKDGRAPIAAAYVLSSTAAGFAAVWLGMAGGRVLPIVRPRRYEEAP